MQYFLVTYGCQMNRSDAERVAAVLEGMGFSPAANESEANVLGVVACSVRQKSADRVYGRSLAWNERSDRGQIITFVTGCVLERDRGKLAKLFDIQFPIQDLPKLPELLISGGFALSADFVFRQSVMSDARTDYWKIAPLAASAHQAWIPIQNGCNRFCAYCAVPYTRGREVSRDPKEILDEIACLLERGYRSFTLLGQNVNSYGRDWSSGEPAFARLLGDAARLIEKSGREALIYFTSPHPSDMQREVFELMAAHPAIARQAHLPMQSGDDAVLRRMHRSYTMERYREIVGWVRELVPDAALFTDIIVGFPGETEEEFEHTREAVQDLAFDMVFTAVYSPRAGTAGAKLPDDIPREEKSRRLGVLQDLLKTMGAEKKKRFIGTTQRVLVDGAAGADIVSARTNGLIPVHVRIPGVNPAEFIGQFIDVRVISASALSLAAEYTAAS
ncbi:MAG: tRNA (N6-isopentenyl adenosine(37)-C2)-methylthiotransferase MiaB [Spirochaetota bacterium]|jgi:tRNA-2-methylthio-N6-dimethylallyladenosine synthase|nr:tRNA (N6-isopentenyl adenosine(37)-C2)-methylthiotransferase MiaB [Spirochaetota bacterium]